MAAGGADAWPLWLFRFVDDVRRRSDAALVADAPDHTLAPRLRALIAPTTETICAECGLGRPDWCAATPPLDRPWCVAGVENLKAAALVESPARFRRRNMFVLANFLNRA